MGINDRPYYRDEQPGMQVSGTAVSVLIGINVVVFLADMLTNGWLSKHFALDTRVAQEPWRAYQLLTYAFLHDLNSIQHIIFNMLGLFFFGRHVEETYGRREMLRSYVSATVVGGLVFLIVRVIQERGFDMPPSGVVGASGGVVFVLILFVLHNPRAQILIFGIIPATAWMVGVGYVALDLLGALGMHKGHVAKIAFEVHLAGAAMAWIYFHHQWQLFAWFPTPGGIRSYLRKQKTKRQLRLVKMEQEEADQMQDQVDKLLDKINAHGRDSLTQSEQAFLMDASQKVRQQLNRNTPRGR